MSDFAAFTHEVGKRVQIIGDDFLVVAGVARAGGGGAQCGECSAAEAQSARHADGDAGCLGGG